MHYLNKITFWQLIFITLTTSSSAQNINSRDYYRTVGELGVFLYLQYGFHTDISNLGEMKPNKFDDIISLVALNRQKPMSNLSLIHI
mgnify:CR=1 FL=1